MLQVEHSAILLTFIKLPFVIKIIVLSIFEWLFYTGFTVFINWRISGFKIAFNQSGCKNCTLFRLIKSFILVDTIMFEWFSIYLQGP